MINARATFRGLAADVAHHTDVSVEIDELTAAIDALDALVDEAGA